MAGASVHSTREASNSEAGCRTSGTEGVDFDDVLALFLRMRDTSACSVFVLLEGVERLSTRVTVAGDDPTPLSLAGPALLLVLGPDATAFAKVATRWSLATIVDALATYFDSVASAGLVEFGDIAVVAGDSASILLLALCSTRSRLSLRNLSSALGFLRSAVVPKLSMLAPPCVSGLSCARLPDAARPRAAVLLLIL